MSGDYRVLATVRKGVAVIFREPSAVQLCYCDYIGRQTTVNGCGDNGRCQFHIIREQSRCVGFRRWWWQFWRPTYEEAIRRLVQRNNATDEWATRAAEVVEVQKLVDEL